MTHFFLLDHFTILPAQKPGGDLDGDSPYVLLLLKMPEVFPKRQLCLHKSQDALHNFLEQAGFQVFFILLHRTASHRAESHQAFAGRLSIPSFMIRAGLSPS